MGRIRPALSLKTGQTVGRTRNLKSSPNRSPVGCSGDGAAPGDFSLPSGVVSEIGVQILGDRSMNPLCCIAPVSVEKDLTPVKSRTLSQEVVFDGNGCNESVIRSNNDNNNSSSSSNVILRHASFNSRRSLSNNGGLHGDTCAESDEIKSVVGILYKWVNYGKGWRERWFVLEDGVLSYYKVHGPDKIAVSCGREKGVRVIGLESWRYMRKGSSGNGSGSGNGLRGCRFGRSGKQWKPFGEIHLKVSSVRASKSDDKRLSIFTGTKTLHLRCQSKEDRASWIEALLVAKDKFPRLLTSNDLAPSEEFVVSTEKLRLRLMQEGISETIVKDCESIMLGELAEMQSHLKTLQLKHILLLDTLRRLETEKIELETTVVDETKGRDSCCGQGNRRFSVLSEGSASDSDADNESRYGVDVETDDDDGIFFDTNDFLSAESLRSASYRSRENPIFAHSPWTCENESSFSGHLKEVGMELKAIEFPYIKRRDNLPEPKEKEKPIGLWSIIKDNIGKDLSGVCLPVYFNEPLSSLQKCFEDLEYSYLVDRALGWGKQGNDLMRILNVAAFAVSGYASTEGRQCKPFNPLLGETYEADYPDKGLRFFSEKVSHHPMVVACHCEGRGWKFWGDSNLKGKFWGRSIQLDPVGVLTLQFEDGETFHWSKVTTSIYNIIIGKIYCDHYGTMRIKGSGNYSCKLKFKEQSIIDRNPHQVHGFVQDNRTGEKVAVLLGKWDEAMYYVLGDPTTKPKGYDPMTEAVLLWERDKSVTNARYNLTPFAVSLNEVTPGLLEKLPPTDSRMRPDQRHLENGEYELANAEKLRLEQLQRQARKLQDRGWQPRWFSKDEDGCYHYTGGYWEAREKNNWDGIPDVFGQPCDFPVSVAENHNERRWPID
ncbi:oxysterol-binding protein-related protein 1d [Phtheirospermum japonicum]|uniref:Oxysterol-binding protein-related protein 1d n=1 Tax=Phtheirospermum japonicum TaxID=374723 RepID=A0A830D2R5_9LAMI|nr:oxysterol-binding protein-related protein 1d [Phtheirospermum japonicum]